MFPPQKRQRLRRRCHALALALALLIAACSGGEAPSAAVPADTGPPPDQRQAPGDASPDAGAFVPQAVALAPPAQAPAANAPGETRSAGVKPRQSDRELAQAFAADDPRMRRPRSLIVPDSDMTAAVTDVEPNDTEEAAQPLGEGLVARGTLTGRNWDFYYFDIDGPPQLWHVEAAGEPLARLYLHDNAGGTTSGRSAPDDPGKLIVANQLLMAGRHRLSLRGGGEAVDYTLRVVALGPPDAAAEREPNDDASRAHPLRAGTSRYGYLPVPSDVDYYRFSSGGEERVLLQVEPPSGVKTRMALWLRNGSNETRIGRVEGIDDTLAYRARLLPGDYLLTVSTLKGVSDAAYGVRFDRLDPFDPAPDVEPNNHFELARPLPDDRVLYGESFTSDPDWYRLPTFDIDTSFVVTPSADMHGQPRLHGRLRLYREDAERLRTIEWDPQEKVFNGTLPAGASVALAVRDPAPYHLTLSFDDGRAAPVARALPVALSLPGAAHTVAAFWHEGQSVSVPLTLANRRAEPITVRLDVVSSHHAWRPALARSSVTLGAKQSVAVPLSVIVAPDAYADQPVFVTVRATADGFSAQTASLSLGAACGAPPVGARQVWPLPDTMLGGFNVVSTRLGAPPGQGKNQPLLQDGFTPQGTPWRRPPPVSLTFELMGDAPIAIAGVALNPKTSRATNERVKDFDVATSLDGVTWSPALSAQLGRQATEQAFEFAAPVEARYVQLTAHSNHGGTTGSVNLGEFKVISVPGEVPFADARLNVADPAIGGYVVWSDPLISRPPHNILLEQANGPIIRLDQNKPSTWVVGFYNDRAAQISELQWVRTADVGHNLMTRVQVSVSVDSPLGPWTPLETWALDAAAGGTATLTLAEPVWARYVRFTNNEPVERGRWHLPDTLRILERATDTTYRSIVGEWGHYAKAAIFEQLEPPAVAADLTETDDNDERESAQALEYGRDYVGSVLVGEDEDWYRIDIPGGANRLRLSVHDEPVLRARLALFDDAQNSVPLEGVLRTDGQRTFLEANVASGRSYYLHIEEPKRSIAFVWDNSGSVTPYKPTVYQAMADFSHGIQLGRESANLLPFSKTGSFLREAWAEHPYQLQETLTNYPRNDTSSNAEFNLHRAVADMRGREGTKAVVLLTDAHTDGYKTTPQLWRELAIVRPRIFSLELHSGSAGQAQHLMQSWASAGDGVYDYFSSNADLAVGFERAACHIRRPARYVLQADTRNEAPPEPGSLVVTAKDVVAQGAIELILDASGSMLQRLDGTRRIAIARDMLTDLVTDTLPPGTPLALRIFGHRKPDACQTDLEVPLAPLDRDAVAKIIAGTNAMNLAKTPIGESLALVQDDLRGVDGQKLIILITDGEETCGGDPEAAIEALKEAGFDVRLNIIGFAIDDAALKADFERWSDAGGGRYFDAKSAQELSGAMAESLRPKFQVLDATGAVMAQATVDSDALALPVGEYTVKVLTSPPRVFENVQIASREKKTLQVEQENRE